MQPYIQIINKTVVPALKPYFLFVLFGVMLMTPWSAVANEPSAVHPEAVHTDVVFSDGRSPVRLRLNISFNQTNVEQVWEEFLDKWLSYFDRDANGLWSMTEAARVFPLPLPEQRQIAMELSRLDTNGDGSVSRKELGDYYRKAGFAPVVTAFRNASPAHLQLSEILFQSLDRDADHSLSRFEIEQAPELMKNFDEDEDEFLTINELLGGSAAFSRLNAIEGVAQTADGPNELRGLAHVPGPSKALAHPVEQAPNQPSATIEAVPTYAEPSIPAPVPNSILNIELGTGVVSMRLSEPAAPGIETIGDSDNRQLRFRAGACYCAVVASEIGRQQTFQAVRGFYQAQFRSAFGDTALVSKRQIEQDPGLKVLVDLFAPADRNGDGQLTFSELTEFLQLVEQGIGCQSNANLSSHGRNVFELLDQDHDKRLSLTELQEAGETLRKICEFDPQNQPGTKGVSRNQIPLQFSLQLERGTSGATFGPVPLPARPKPGAVSAVAAKSITRDSDSSTSKAAHPVPKPRWFENLDRNSNGSLSAQEFPASNEIFIRFDVNRDGRISLDEALAAEQRKSSSAP